jgi:hypothetical protein
MSLSQDLTDAINKNLSAEVGQTLQKELARIPELEAALRRAEVREKEQKITIEVLGKKVDEGAALNAKSDALDALERELLLREKKLAIAEAVAASRKAVDDARILDLKEVVGLVFRNQIVRQEMFKNTTVPVTTNGYTSTVQGPSEAVTTRQVPE